MHIKKHLSFTGLRKIISQRFGQIQDRRRGEVVYSLHDCLMSALAMMFFQDPSLLQFQRRLQQGLHRHNLQSLFGVKEIPGDTQLRDLIDTCDPKQVEAIFADFFRQLQRGKHLESYQVLDGRYLVVLDGTEYFSSEKICCPGCLFQKSVSGQVRYHHQILQAALVHPACRQVIPLAPEPIKNEDGSEKQDCEINAGKRIIKKIRQNHPKLKIIIGGDGLYSKQPFLEALQKVGLSFVLVAKPTDHKVLFEWFGEIQKMKETGHLEITDHQKRRHCYEWAQGLPLNGDPRAPEVNFFQYRLLVHGETTYHNSWVTDLKVNEHNVVELVKAGRSRWKIENEGFNTLKNQGYHIEHNFGHGQLNLSYIFFLLNLLAFFCHQVFELTDPLYRRGRAAFSSRLEYWNQLRCTIRIWVFPDWETLLAVIIDPERHPPP
ncbi:MAG: hypothetical protein AB1641_01610 [Thermodesulfobacteriota bacterium]